MKRLRRCTGNMDCRLRMALQSSIVMLGVSVALIVLLAP